MKRSIEHMAYKNFFFRTIISIFILITYISLSLINFNYVFYLILLIYLLICIEVILYFKKYKLIIFLYLLISFLSLFNIDFTEENFVKFNLMILIIISFDIFSYLIGSLLGKNKILFYISPNKTAEGLIGGIFFTLLITIVYSSFFLIQINYKIIFFIFIVILSSFIGDIIESIFKRLNNLKNSSNFLPGHGGFFDRFDSFVLSIFIYSFIIKMI